jgi:hypothetical protein
MLNKMKLRALSPGQWARIRVPDYECWQKSDGWSESLAGKEVDVCVIPCYGPEYDSKDRLHWSYRAAYRHPRSGGWSNYCQPGGGIISAWDLGLIDTSHGGPNWDIETMREHYEGKGKWLYDPASEDPELCPGGDWSRYECDGCGKFVRPFSNDQGELICGICETMGLVCFDEETLDHLEAVRNWARDAGLLCQSNRQLDYLADYGSNGYQCVLSKDFAPHSFTFGMYRPGTNETRKFSFMGGLIYQGPSCPADGPFPSLTVSLASGTGWFCHT